MDDLHIIENRIKNLQKTKQMTHTMRLVASLKVHQLERKVSDMALYMRTLRDFAQNVIATIDEQSDIGALLEMSASSLLKSMMSSKYNPYQKKNERDMFDFRGLDNAEGETIEELIVIIGGQHGLAGGFQSALHELLVRDVQQHRDISAGYRLLAIGEKGRGIAKGTSVPMIDHIVPPEDADQACAEIWYKLCEVVCTNQVKKITVLSHRFYSASRQQPEFTTILPLDAVHGRARRKGQGLLLASRVGEAKLGEGGVRKVSSIKVENNIPVEPELDKWLGELLLRVSYANLLQLLRESLAAEYIQRLHAMTSATNNADELLHDLQLDFQRSRQAKITQDILDILGGSDL